MIGVTIHFLANTTARAEGWEQASDNTLFKIDDILAKGNRVRISGNLL
jgi:hypothetical protein